MTYLKTAFFTSKRELQTANMTAGTSSRDFLTFAVRGKCRKTSILISLLSVLKNIENKCTLKPKMQFYSERRSRRHLVEWVTSQTVDY